METRKYTIELYDPTDTNSAVPKQIRVLTDAQKAALEKGRNQQKYNAWFK